jgi:hypothetical protein
VLLEKLGKMNVMPLSLKYSTNKQKTTNKVFQSRQSTTFTYALNLGSVRIIGLRRVAEKLCCFLFIFWCCNKTYFLSLLRPNHFVSYSIFNQTYFIIIVIVSYVCLFHIIIQISLVWCPGQNKRISPLSFLHGCRKKRLND